MEVVALDVIEIGHGDVRDARLREGEGARRADPAGPDEQYGAAQGRGPDVLRGGVLDVRRAHLKNSSRLK